MFAVAADWAETSLLLLLRCADDTQLHEVIQATILKNVFDDFAIFNAVNGDATPPKEMPSGRSSSMTATMNFWKKCTISLAVL